MLVRTVCGPSLAEELSDLSRRLSVSGAVASPASRELTRRAFGEDLAPQEVVRRIVADVSRRGDEAVAEYAFKLDGADLTPERFRVDPAEMARAHAEAAPAFLDAVRRAAGNVGRYQRHFAAAPPPPLRPRPGVVLEMRFRALRRVGVCIPSARAALASCLIMIAVPAQVAGVEELATVTPCRPDGRVAPQLLATAHELGITEVYRIGGAQAVAALAFGTRTIPRVDKIAGPGNIFVNLAKKEVYGHVDIDMIAGPSEILIVADEGASPRFCAADMLGQAEHDPAASVLLTPSPELARATGAEIERRLPGLARAEAARASLSRYGLIGVARDLDECVALADAFAPEHLEILTARPEEILARLRNYGTAFLGPYSPEPVGDYIAGPSHVLPTGGTARFYSGLSFHDFLRRSSVVRYSREALAEALPDICQLAGAEGLDGHAVSARIRLESEDGR